MTKAHVQYHVSNKNSVTRGFFFFFFGTNLKRVEFGYIVRRNMSLVNSKLEIKIFNKIEYIVIF